jgi:hypothetical protein
MNGFYCQLFLDKIKRKKLYKMSEKHIIFTFIKKFKVLNVLKEDFLNEIRLLHVFNGNNVFIVTNDDKVFAFGANGCGVLGFGNNNRVNDLIINEELSYKQIIDFKNSFYHVIARNINGKVYCWGHNRFGVLGNGKNDYNIFKPELNEYLSDKQIIDICCGHNFSVMLTNSGEVYGWGWNEFGQIGNKSSFYESIPIKVNGFKEKVIMISCGGLHSMALTESGRVFSWGRNDCGHLGHNNQNNSNEPTIVSLSYEIRIEKISCGFRHSLLLSQNGDIYWFGNNVYEGQITPKKLKINENQFIDIASHSHHFISTALTDNEKYYVWDKCGNEVIKEPKETEFISFDDIFADYLQITYKTFDCYSILSRKFVPNGKYKREFLEILEIGRGSYGKVFKVKNYITNEISAIKKIPVINENESFKELINSFIISELNSPLIARYHDVWYE